VFITDDRTTAAAAAAAAAAGDDGTVYVEGMFILQGLLAQCDYITWYSTLFI